MQANLIDGDRRQWRASGAQLPSCRQLVSSLGILFCHGWIPHLLGRAAITEEISKLVGLGDVWVENLKATALNKPAWSWRGEVNRGWGVGQGGTGGPE